MQKKQTKNRPRNETAEAGQKMDYSGEIGGSGVVNVQRSTLAPFVGDEDKFSVAACNLWYRTARYPRPQLLAASP